MSMSKALGAGGLKGNKIVPPVFKCNYFVTSDARATTRPVGTCYCTVNGKVSVSDLFQHIVVSSASDERHNHLCEFGQFPGLK
jgi:hypothetical protein